MAGFIRFSEEIMRLSVSVWRSVTSCRFISGFSHSSSKSLSIYPYRMTSVFKNWQDCIQDKREQDMVKFFLIINLSVLEIRQWNLLQTTCSIYPSRDKYVEDAVPPVYMKVKVRFPISWLQHESVGECEECADPMLLTPLAWPPQPAQQFCCFTDLLTCKRWRKSTFCADTQSKVRTSHISVHVCPSNL